MPAVRCTPPSSLDSTDPPLLHPVDTCASCGRSSIDVWMSTTYNTSTCKKCLLDKEHLPLDDILLCPGSRFGCKYQTSIARECAVHLRTCPRRPTQCPNECSSIVPNVHLPEHLTDECVRRTQECRFCHGNYFVSEIGNHFKNCAEYPVTCRFCNQENIRRGKLNEHGAGCRKTPKLCKMASLGCAFEAGDDEMQHHMTLEKHAFFIHESKMQVNSLEAEVRRLREERNREKLEEQKAQEKLRKEEQIRDKEVQNLLAQIQALKAQFGGTLE
ncbi:TNF receptor-associated factor 5-like [Ornithodoros turicata]|uniref:TNF receptor-associated factor 5-like n=1 Tax=Ornithodoros turicata TaxID=34597 RepID=UPI0031389295